MSGKRMPENGRFNVRALSEHVRILASDEFEGRAPASEGEAKTIAYLSEQFARLGVQPAADSGSWTQAVSLRKIELTQAGALRVTAAGEAFEFRHGEEAV